jgi:hypothetical protein
VQSQIDAIVAKDLEYQRANERASLPVRLQAAIDDQAHPVMIPIGTREGTRLQLAEVTFGLRDVGTLPLRREPSTEDVQAEVEQALLATPEGAAALAKWKADGR